MVNYIDAPLLLELEANASKLAIAIACYCWWTQSCRCDTSLFCNYKFTQESCAIAKMTARCALY